MSFLNGYPRTSVVVDDTMLASGAYIRENSWRYILVLPEVLNRIIVAKGCVVQDQYLRNGGRSRRADDKGEWKNKPVSKQRISTNCARPLHPDCIEAFEKITDAALANLNNALDAQAEYVELIEAANNGTLDSSDEPTILHTDEAAEFLDN